MIYRGKVTAVDLRGVFVRVSALNPQPFGPLPRTFTTAPSVGASVLVADAGDAASPDLIVIGVVS